MKKLRNKKGFTLTEMLISVLLLGFVSIMVTVMTSAILSSTVTMREVAQAEILGSEALDNLQGQLRVAHNITLADDVVTFDIDNANKGYVFSVDEKGKIVMEHEKNGEKVTELLFAGASYGNLSVKSLEFAASGDDSIEISVSISFGDKTLWRGSVTVKPLNGISTV